MATVKLQDGKVILKNGKVSCSCCGGECCMYPAQALIDGLYTADDLPDEVLLFNANWSPPEGTILTKNGSIYEGPDITISARSPDPLLPIDWILDTPEGWEYVNVNSPNCLFEEDLYDGVGQGAIDQFADTYTVTTSNESVLVSRQSLCVWSGLDSCGNAWQLVYGDSSDITPTGELRWNIIDAEVSSPCQVPPTIRGISWKDPGENNSPVGSYPNGTAVDATVS